jgi:tRNA threonylcarbamoyl adenosine modification protein YeaZ
VTANWTLALETSVTNATLLLARNDEPFASRSFASERSQECDLFGPLTSLLAELPDDERLTTIIIGTGPGSYNGARVGIATAQATAQIHQCRIAGLCSFEGVAEASQSDTLWAIGDARRGSYFLMPIMNGRAQTPPCLLEESGFLAQLADCPGPKVTFESPDRLPAGIECCESHSTATGLLQSWLTRSPEEKETLLSTPTEAFYLRPPHITKAKKK